MLQIKRMNEVAYEKTMDALKHTHQVAMLVCVCVCQRCAFRCLRQQSARVPCVLLLLLLDRLS